METKKDTETRGAEATTVLFIVAGLLMILGYGIRALTYHPEPTPPQIVEVPTSSVSFLTEEAECKKVGGVFRINDSTYEQKWYDSVVMVHKSTSPELPSYELTCDTTKRVFDYKIK